MTPVRVWSNAALVVLATLPALIEYYLILRLCPHPSPPIPDHTKTVLQHGCSLSTQHPLLLANVLLALNMDVYLWLLGLLQRSTWLIDIFWTLIPPLMLHFYALHPAALHASPASPDAYRHARLRTLLTLVLTYAWAARLTHSYLRREQYQLGAREDWRFTQLRALITPRYGAAAWGVACLFLAYVSQHPFRFGFTLPFYVVFTSSAPLSALDAAGALLCVASLALAERADTTLYQYTQRPVGERPPVLDEGVWRYSRHPNHAGESGFWIGRGLIGAGAGMAGGGGLAWWWYLVGGVCNAGLLVVVSFWVEWRMVAKAERAEAYRAYQKRVSMIVPWFRSGEPSSDQKRKAE